MTLESIHYSSPIGDEYAWMVYCMGAGRYGIVIHLKNGRIRHIDGNRDHPAGIEFFAETSHVSTLHYRR